MRAVEVKKFNSLHIDINNGVYELNGEKMEGVTELSLNWEDGEWVLNISKDEIYSRPTAKVTTE